MKTKTAHAIATGFLTSHFTPRSVSRGVPAESEALAPYVGIGWYRKHGDVLFCSLLFVQACRQLSDLLNDRGREDEADIWRQTGHRVAQSIRDHFWDPKVGLFRAATVQCREHDIWGSAFAVYLGVADVSQSLAIANTFKTHYAELVQHGQIRHLPGGVYWERGYARDTYQNGAFWATPTGWFVYALDLVDPALADRTIIDMVRHFQTYGACEWIFGDQRTLPNYLASASLPLAGIRAMLKRRAALNLKMPPSQSTLGTQRNEPRKTISHTCPQGRDTGAQREPTTNN